MTEEKANPQPEEPAPPKEPAVKPFTPEILKRPNFQPPKFKYVPPKSGKRHF